MTEAMIDRLRELLWAGSPLPWRSVAVRESEGSFVVLWHEVHDANDRMLPDGEPDASLIVEAVNALPELLDAHDRMAGALVGLGGMVDWLTEHHRNVVVEMPNEHSRAIEAAGFAVRAAVDADQ